MSALGLIVWPMVAFEADDALATAAKIYARQPKVTQVLICTPDKDLAQCVNGQKIVCWDRHRKILLDEPGVVEKFGVPPASIPDLLALVGDPQDGIPGIARWGMKSAAQVLACYGSIDSIPTQASAWKVKVRGQDTLAHNLATAKSAAALYRRLATLRFDVPLKETLTELQWQGADLKALNAICAEIGDDSVLRRIQKWR